MTWHSLNGSATTAILVAAVLSGAPAAAAAAELAPILAMPSSKVPLKPSAAVLHALKIRLPQAQGLAHTLIQAGVDQADATAAAKLAAGHLGDGHGGCEAKIEISGALEGGGYRLQRAVLLTASTQTVIERRGSELTIASEQLTTTAVRLV